MRNRVAARVGAASEADPIARRIAPNFLREVIDPFGFAFSLSLARETYVNARVVLYRLQLQVAFRTCFATCLGRHYPATPGGRVVQKSPVPVSDAIWTGGAFG